MREFITVVCFVLLLTGLGMAERVYLKWKTYVACSEVNLLVAQGQIHRTMEYVKSNAKLLPVDTIDDAVDMCRVAES